MSTANTVHGSGAGGALTTGTGNVLYGDAAGATLTTGSDNVVIGADADVAAVDTTDAVVIGKDAVGTTQTVAVGWEAHQNITGTDNVAVGYVAMGGAGGTATRNVAVGSFAGFGLTNGVDNAIVGAGAMLSATTASQCVAVGYNALNAATTGDDNIGVGAGALGQGLLSGDGNIGIGYRAGYNVSSGTQNVLVGEQAGDTLTTGSYNVLIGDQADVDNNNEDYAVGVGEGVVVTGRAIAVGQGVSNTVANSAVIGQGAAYQLICSNTITWGTNFYTASEVNTYSAPGGNIDLETVPERMGPGALIIVDTLAAARNLLTPVAATILATYRNDLEDNDSWTFYVNNRDATVGDNVTLTAGDANVTIIGSGQVDPQSTRPFIVRRTSATTVEINSTFLANE